MAKQARRDLEMMMTNVEDYADDDDDDDDDQWVDVT